mgnify:FL=1
MITRNRSERGSVNGWMVGTIGCLILFLIAGSLAIWAYMQYSREKSSVDSKVAIKVAEGKREQAEYDWRKCSDDAKNLRVEFVGPAEYGRVSFMYTKTWSVYIANDGSDRGDYKAYFHPISVPPITNKNSRFALRLEIINKNMDTVLNDYQSRLKKGELTSSSTEFNGISATRIDGTFEKELRGSVVLMKVRDKTIRFSTDADTFKPDFQTILSTVKISE